MRCYAKLFHTIQLLFMTMTCFAWADTIIEADQIKTPSLNVSGSILSPFLDNLPYKMSVTAAMGVAHGQMLTSVILHDYEQIVTNKATADAFCLNKINSSWKGCGVIKQNYYNQDCEAGDTLLYGYNYVTYVPTLTMSSSTWVSCHIKGKAFIACSPSC